MVIVECLLKHGVDINTYDWVQESKGFFFVYGVILQDSVITSIVVFSSYILFHSYFSLKHKLKKQTNLYFQNGGTPLLYAVRGNHIECVKALLCMFVHF